MRKKILMWSVIIFLIPSLACGLIGGGEEEEAAPAPVETEAEDSVEEEVSEVESSTETEAVTEAEAESSTTDEQASEETMAEQDEAAMNEAEAGNEATKVELANTSGLENLSSYRVSFVMEFDGESGGQPAQGTVNLLMEATQEPAASHLTMDIEGSTMEQMEGLNRLEVYNVDGTVYMYNDAMGGQWISMPSGTDDTFSQGFFAPDENLQVPDTANCASGTETINNIETTLCTFDATDIQDVAEAEYDQVDGRIWLAKDGGYVVKYEVDMDGFRPGAASQEGLFDYGDVTMSYELLEANTDIIIEVPAEAQNSQGLDFGGLTGGDEPASADVPVLDDAEELFTVAGMTTYVSASSVDEAIEFYRQSLADEGWTENAEEALVAGSTAILTFEKEGSTLTVSITEEAEGRVNINIISS